MTRNTTHWITTATCAAVACLITLALNTTPTAVAEPTQHTNDTAQQIQRLVDREAIKDVVKAYALSMDTRDWDLHRSIFTESYQLYRNGTYRDEHIDNRVKRLDAFTQRYAWTQHLASIYSIEIDGDSAFVISSLNANHKGQANEGGRRTGDYLMVGFYHYWLTRTPDGWKIAKMRLLRANR